MVSKITPLRVLFLCILVLVTIVAISFVTNAKSQKLPAQVKTDKTILSSEISGVVSAYLVALNQPVQENQLVMEMTNNRIKEKLDALNSEKDRYLRLIESANSGDELKIELMKIENDLIKKRTDLKKEISDSLLISHKLPIYQKRFQVVEKQYDALNKLFEENKISASEFEKKIDDYYDIKDKYLQMKSDLLNTVEKINSLRKEIALFEEKATIYKGNVSLLASKHQLELNKINIEISELKEDLSKLSIKSPVDGIITEIYNTHGERINRGDRIVEITTINNIWIEAYGNSFSRRSIKTGQKVSIYCANGEILKAEVVSVSPIMERIRALDSSFDSQNTYSKIEIKFLDFTEAEKNLTPGERLFVKVYF